MTAPTTLDLVDLYAHGDPARGPSAILGVQARLQLREEVVVEYLDLLVEGVQLPPIGVIAVSDDESGDDTGGLLVWDGYHRLEAHRRAGRLQIEAILEPGTELDALRKAAGANADHGLRRSAADKRHAVQLLLEHEAYTRWSDRAIAEACRVHHSFVGRLRRELELDAGDATGAGATRVGRDGREIRTEAIATANRKRTTQDYVDEGLAAEDAEADRILARAAEERVAALPPEDGGQDRDEDLDGGSSPPAEVVTGHGVETARPPSSDRGARLARADEEYVLDEHDPIDLTRHPKVAAHRFVGRDPEVRLTAEEIVTWRDQLWVALGGEYAGPYDSVHLARLMAPNATPRPLRACDRFRHDHGRIVCQGKRRWVLDCTSVARVSWGVRRPDHATELDHQRGVPVFTEDELAAWYAEPIGSERRVELEAAARRRRHEAASPAVDRVVGPLAPIDEAPVEGEAPPRAPLDAYYTPIRTAVACVDYVLDLVTEVRGAIPGLDIGPDGAEFERIVEPSVGGGAWVQALKALLPRARIDRVDVDPAAPGLQLERRSAERAHVGDWCGPAVDLLAGSRSWQLVIGNPPYGDQVLPHAEAALKRASVVALLLRETITGTDTRLPWWRRNRPAAVAKVVPRPRWQGPGARPTSDYSDTVLVVWIRGWPGATRWGWIDTESIAGEIVGCGEE